MAIQSLTDLKALINSTIQDNTTNDISGSDVQTALINAIDTLDSLEGFINVHKANGQTTITAYGSKALARAAVPDDCKKEGVVIAYKISTGWLIEQNLDATAGTWGDDTSWQTIGPVSVSQNTSTGGLDVNIGANAYNVRDEKQIETPETLIDVVEFPYFGYYRTNHTWVDSDGDRVSKYYKVQSGWKILVNISPDDGVIYTIIAFNANMEVLWDKCVSGNLSNYEYTVQSDVKYIRFGTRAGAAYQSAAAVKFPISISDIQADISDIQADISDISENDITPITITNNVEFPFFGYYRWDSQTFVESDGDKLTRFIEVQEGWKILINISPDDNVINTLTALNGAKEVLWDKCVHGNLQNYEYVVPSGVRYLRFGTRAGAAYLSAASVRFYLPIETEIAKELIRDNIANPINIFEGYVNSLGQINTNPEDTRGVARVIEIPVKSFGVISFGNNYIGSGDTAYYAFWNGKYNSGSLVSFAQQDVNRVVKKENIAVPDGATYLYVTLRGAGTDSADYAKFTCNYGIKLQEYSVNIEVVSVIDDIDNYVIEKRDIPNLANPSNIFAGYVTSNGMIVTGASYTNARCIEVAVKEGEKISFGNYTLDLSDTAYYSFLSDHYDNDGTVVDWGGITRGNVRAENLTIPSGAKYLYFTLKQTPSTASVDDYANVMCNVGATLLSYVPYSEYVGRINGVEVKSYDEEIKELRENTSICSDFSDVDNKLYYKGSPIATESSLSAVVADLPVSDGTGIQSGYAYIDSTDRTIKVKA